MIVFEKRGVLSVRYIGFYSIWNIYSKFIFKKNLNVWFFRSLKNFFKTPAPKIFKTTTPTPALTKKS